MGFPLRGTPPWGLLLFQVSTHHLHSSSEDEDMESAFPNELSLQQVSAMPGPRASGPRKLRE